MNFPSFASQCQPGSSCTSCLCQLSKAMGVAQSDPHDVTLCMKNFRCGWAGVDACSNSVPGNLDPRDDVSRVQFCPHAAPC